MANTSYLKKEVEPVLVQWASEKLGVPLSKKRVVVGQNSQGEDVSFEFDGVSADGGIAVCVSASSSYKTGQMRKFFMEATLLNQVPQFRQRAMVFISENIRKGFKNQCDGLVDLGKIELLVCTDLREDMKVKIREIFRSAAKEVRAKRGPGKHVQRRRR